MSGSVERAASTPHSSPIDWRTGSSGCTSSRAHSLPSRPCLDVAEQGRQASAGSVATSWLSRESSDGARKFSKRRGDTGESARAMPSRMRMPSPAAVGMRAPLEPSQPLVEVTLPLARPSTGREDGSRDVRVGTAETKLSLSLAPEMCARPAATTTTRKPMPCCAVLVRGLDGDPDAVHAMLSMRREARPMITMGFRDDTVLRKSDHSWKYNFQRNDRSRVTLEIVHLFSDPGLFGGSGLF